MGSLPAFIVEHTGGSLSAETAKFPYSSRRIRFPSITTDHVFEHLLSAQHAAASTIAACSSILSHVSSAPICIRNVRDHGMTDILYGETDQIHTDSLNPATNFPQPLLFRTPPPHFHSQLSTPLSLVTGAGKEYVDWHFCTRRSNSYHTTAGPNVGIPMRPATYVSANNSRHASPTEPESQVRVIESRPKPQCWDHGCNGREFSTFSNLLRHQRERSGAAAKSECPHCGAVFTRTTARNTHIAQGKCKGIRETTEQ